jgi:hypothetical protein
MLGDRKFSALPCGLRRECGSDMTTDEVEAQAIAAEPGRGFAACRKD